MGLTEYKKKRNFRGHGRTEGQAVAKAGQGRIPFRHSKTRRQPVALRFSPANGWRAEIVGCAEGGSVEKGEKHLAVEVEDHPIEYATFEGIIPKGQYGGGTVMLWDRGNYHVYGEEPLKALQEGRLHLVLDGEKAKGEWALIRTRMEAGKPQWLLLKSGASPADLEKARRSIGQDRAHDGADCGATRRGVGIESTGDSKSELNPESKRRLKKKKKHKARRKTRDGADESAQSLPRRISEIARRANRVSSRR